MRERSDFVIRSEGLWNRLVALYGGGPAIPRKVVSTGWSKSVETHLYKLQFLRSSDMNTIVIGHFRFFWFCCFAKKNNNNISFVVLQQGRQDQGSAQHHV